MTWLITWVQSVSIRRRAAGDQRRREVSVQSPNLRGARVFWAGITEYDFEQGPEGNEAAVHGGSTFLVMEAARAEAQGSSRPVWEQPEGGCARPTGAEQRPRGSPPPVKAPVLLESPSIRRGVSSRPVFPSHRVNEWSDWWGKRHACLQGLCGACQLASCTDKDTHVV